MKTTIDRETDLAYVNFKWSGKLDPTLSRDGTMVFQLDPETGDWKLIKLEGDTTFLQLTSVAEKTERDVDNKDTIDSYCSYSGVPVERYAGTDRYCMISDVRSKIENGVEADEDFSYEYLKFTVRGFDNGGNRVSDEAVISCDSGGKGRFFTSDTQDADRNGEAVFQFDPDYDTGDIRITCSIGNVSVDVATVHVEVNKPPPMPPPED